MFEVCLLALLTTLSKFSIFLTATDSTFLHYHQKECLYQKPHNPPISSYFHPNSLRGLSFMSSYQIPTKFTHFCVPCPELQ